PLEHFAGGRLRRARVVALAAGSPHLDQAQLRDVSRDGGLRGDESGGPQALQELRLGFNRVFLDKAQDGLLPLFLHWVSASLSASPPAVPRCPRRMRNSR